MPNEESTLYTKALVAYLRHSCPLLLPVRVYYRDKLPGELGHAVLHCLDDVPQRFTITILKTDVFLMREILIHEWAHCRAWSPGDSGEVFDDHPDDWGIAFARVYRSLLGSGL